MLGLYCCSDFSLVVGSGGYSLVAAHRFLLAVDSLVSEHGLSGSRASAVVTCVLSSCKSEALEHRLNSRGLVTPRYVGSSWIWDRTHVSRIDRCILYCWATREALVNLILWWSGEGPHLPQPWEASLALGPCPIDARARPQGDPPVAIPPPDIAGDSMTRPLPLSLIIRHGGLGQLTYLPLLQAHPSSSRRSFRDLRSATQTPLSRQAG